MKVQPTHRVWDREACASRGGDVPERAGPKTSSCGAGHARDTKSNVLDAHPAVVQAGVPQSLLVVRIENDRFYKYGTQQARDTEQADQPG